MSAKQLASIVQAAGYTLTRARGAWLLWDGAKRLVADGTLREVYSEFSKLTRKR
jgi:hypothetical protein